MSCGEFNGGFWPCEEPDLTRISGALADGLIYIVGQMSIVLIVLRITH